MSYSTEKNKLGVPARSTTKSDYQINSTPSNDDKLHKSGNINYSYALVQKSQSLIENSRSVLEETIRLSQELRSIYPFEQ